MIACHKFVLDACSDYFAGFLKNKLLDDRNIVICLPNTIKLWEIQALLQFMYHGEVCISQEGLASLVKCAELLQVKGLCGNETTSIVSKDKEASSQPKTKSNDETTDEAEQTAGESAEMIEADVNKSECDEYNDQMIIKREINISELSLSCNFLFCFKSFFYNQMKLILRTKLWMETIKITSFQCLVIRLLG